MIEDQEEKQELIGQLDGSSSSTIVSQTCDQTKSKKVLDDFKKMKALLIGFLLGYSICYGVKNESVMSLILIIVCLITCVLTMIEIENK